MPTDPTPEPDTSGYTELTGEQFVEVMRTGKCAAYQAIVLGDSNKTIIIDKVLVSSFILVTQGCFSNSIVIKKAVFNDTFSIIGGTFKNNFSIEGGVFKSYFSIGGVIFEDMFLINGSIFKNKFLITGGTFNNHFSINRGTFENYFVISKGTFENYFVIKGGIFKNDFWIEGGLFNSKFLICGGTFENNLGIRGGTFEDLIVSSLNNALTFSVHPNNIIRINHLSLLNIHSSLTFNYSSIPFGSLRLENVHSLRKLRIINTDLVAPTQQVTILNSTLTNTEIIGCDWSKATLQVDNSNLLGLFYTDTLFPQTITSAEDDTTKAKEQIRDTYSQLKTIADKQNDREASLYFQSRANDQLYNLKRNHLRLSNLFSAQTTEFIQLWLNKYSNNFGQSYARALGMLIFFTVLLYSFYVPSVSKNLCWTWDYEQWSTGLAYGFKHYWNEYFYFINPVRRVDFFCQKQACKSQLSQIAAPIDWFSRIVVFYLTYQFVQAFRKYGRA